MPRFTPGFPDLLLSVRDSDSEADNTMLCQNHIPLGFAGAVPGRSQSGWPLQAMLLHACLALFRCF